MTPPQLLALKQRFPEEYETARERATREMDER
jgi:hypothetical protein